MGCTSTAGLQNFLPSYSGADITLLSVRLTHLHTWYLGWHNVLVKKLPNFKELKKNWVKCSEVQRIGVMWSEKKWSDDLKWIVYIVIDFYLCVCMYVLCRTLPTYYLILLDIFNYSKCFIVFFYVFCFYFHFLFNILNVFYSFWHYFFFYPYLSYFCKCQPTSAFGFKSNCCKKNNISSH